MSCPNADVRLCRACPATAMLNIMTTTEAVSAAMTGPTTAAGSGTGSAPEAGTGSGPAARARVSATAGEPVPVRYEPLPVWFFAFEGLMGGAYDVIKAYRYGWVLLVVAGLTNLVASRTVLRGRMKSARAMFKGRRTRRIAIGLIAARVAVHMVLGAAGAQARSGPAHLILAVLMCGATISLLAVNQRVTLRALNG
jgi:hypothetical protein